MPPANDTNNHRAGRGVRSRPKVAPIGLRDLEAAAFIGVSISALHRGVAAGTIPAPLRVGGCRVFDRRALARWMSCGCPSAAVFATLEAARRARR